MRVKMKWEPTNVNKIKNVRETEHVPFLVGVRVWVVVRNSVKLMRVRIDGVLIDVVRMTSVRVIEHVLDIDGVRVKAIVIIFQEGWIIYLKIIFTQNA